MSPMFAFAAMLACIGSSAAASPSLAVSDLAGAWRCGPTLMLGPGFTVTVTDETTRLTDGTFTSHTTTVIAAPGKPPITLRDRSNGTWELKGDVVSSHVLRAEFLSASDPSITKEAGQKAQDDQLAKKSVYTSRILEFTGTRSRSIPVNPMYKEAAVESRCVRI
jgi:hypothetical protein